MFFQTRWGKDVEKNVDKIVENPEFPVRKMVYKWSDTPSRVNLGDGHIWVCLKLGDPNLYIDGWWLIIMFTIQRVISRIPGRAWYV